MGIFNAHQTFRAISLKIVLVSEIEREREGEMERERERENVYLCLPTALCVCVRTRACELWRPEGQAQPPLPAAQKQVSELHRGEGEEDGHARPLLRHGVVASPHDVQDHPRKEV